MSRPHTVDPEELRAFHFEYLYASAYTDDGSRKLLTIYVEGGYVYYRVTLGTQVLKDTHAYYLAAEAYNEAG